jgi:hypothetical protein
VRKTLRVSSFSTEDRLAYARRERKKRRVQTHTQHTPTVAPSIQHNAGRGIRTRSTLPPWHHPFNTKQGGRSAHAAHSHRGTIHSTQSRAGDTHNVHRLKTTFS